MVERMYIPHYIIVRATYLCMLYVIGPVTGFFHKIGQFYFIGYFFFTAVKMIHVYNIILLTCHALWPRYIISCDYTYIQDGLYVEH